MSSSLSLNANVPAPITTYTNLVTSEYWNSTNFLATIAACVQPFADINAVVQSFPTNYDLFVAVGANLDTTALWIGTTRFLAEAINSYFSFNTSGLGFNQAVWFTTGAPSTGIVVLDDSSFRLLLEAKAIANSWDGTVQNAYDAWETLFGAETGYATAPAVGGGYNLITAVVAGTNSFVTAPIFGNISDIAIQDMGNMQMMFVLTGQTPSALILALFESGDLALYPAGVTVYLAVPSVYPGAVSGGTPLFGLDAENITVSGLDVGAWVSVVVTS